LESRGTLLLASLAGASAVVLGAFGAHGLEARLSPEALATWQTATHYHLIHALALIGAGLWQALAAGRAATARRLRWASVSFLAGILLFSGSLYALALGAGRWFGPVTPLGGLAFVAGWLLLFDGARRWHAPHDP